MCKSTTQTWVKITHPKTGKFIGLYCPQTNQLDVVDRRERAVVTLPVK